MIEAHLVLIGLLLVADGQVGSVDIQVDVAVTSDAPATLLSSRHPLELHLDVVALLPLLARRGKAEDTTVHVHRPQQGCWHGCTSNLQRIRTKAQRFVYIMLFLSICFRPECLKTQHDQLFEKEAPKCQEQLRCVLAVMFVATSSAPAIVQAIIYVSGSAVCCCCGEWVAAEDSGDPAKMLLLKGAARVTDILQPQIPPGQQRKLGRLLFHQRCSAVR